MNLKFSLNDPNRERSAVTARFTYNKTRPKFSTGITVPSALWLADNSGVKISQQITAKHGMNPMTAQNINDTLAKIKRQFALAWGEELKQDEFDVKRVIARAKTGEVKKPTNKKAVSRHRKGIHIIRTRQSSWQKRRTNEGVNNETVSHCNPSSSCIK